MSDMWEVAKNMEKEGIEHYRTCAEQSAFDGLSGIYTYLAKQEEKHLRFFESMQAGAGIEPVVQEDVLGDVKKAFQEMVSQFDIPEVIEDAESAYGKALEMEKKAVDYYGEILDKAEGDAQDALSVIIEEEKKHARILEAVLEFVKRPKQWVENAEFNHLEEY